MCQRNRQRHVVVRFVGSIAEHHALVASADGIELICIAFLLFQGVIDAHGDIRRLFVQGDEDAAGIAVKAVFSAGITDIADRFADDVRNIDVARRRDFADDVYHAGRYQGFASNAGVFIFCKNGIQNAVRNLVGHFIGMAFGDGFGCKEMMSHCYSSLSVVPGKETSAPTADGALGKGEDPHLSICTAGFGTLQVSAGCRASQGRSLRHS